ncbi:MAG: protein-L-isoaspartate(D-aspartate) O-methyltransferase [Thiohalobacteraceae bacterium]
MKPERRMLRDIERGVEYTRHLTGKEAFAKRVMDAFERVPRQEFVPEDLRGRAYDDAPLPIGGGQTISQPYIVALMTDLLETQPDDIVLEVGTGSGYQAAILSGLVRQVYSIEVIEALATEARARLRRLGYANVEVRSGDGYNGWPEHAPFDGIIVTAAAPFIPEPLVEQLKPGGRLVIPVGVPYGEQDLMLVEKTPEGETRSRRILAVAFVPLTRRQGDEHSAG